MLPPTREEAVWVRIFEQSLKTDQHIRFSSPGGARKLASALRTYRAKLLDLDTSRLDRAKLGATTSLVVVEGSTVVVRTGGADQALEDLS